MIERALRGSATYTVWVGALIATSCLALIMFVLQMQRGLGITAMSRDVPWGFYIAQLTFLVGVAASAVMVVLPYYLHDFRAFRRVTILGEFLAIPAVLLCPLFVLVDLGQPLRVLNLFLHPSPSSMLFWDTVALFGYLILNLVIGWNTLLAERNGLPPPRWVKALIYASIPWAFSIHTVTAFLYCGLAGRSFWHTAILVPRFLASAFAAGPALLLLLCFVVRRFTTLDPGNAAIRALGRIVTYAMLANLFLLGVELFTVLYGGSHHHVVHFQYLFFGVDGQVDSVVVFMWAAMAAGVSAVLLLLMPSTHQSERRLQLACVLVFGSVWIDKGAGLLTGGFVPNPLGQITPYFPSSVEVIMGIGIYAFGALVLTILYKVAVSVKSESTA